MRPIAAALGVLALLLGGSAAAGDAFAPRAMACAGCQGEQGRATVKDARWMW